MPDSLSTIHHTAHSAVVAASADTIAEPTAYALPDSAYAAHFAGCPAPLSVPVDTTEPVRIERVELNPVLRGEDVPMDSTFYRFCSPQLRAKLGPMSTEVSAADGVIGDPRPYRFRDDAYLTGSLLLSLFVIAWVVVSSWKFLRQQLRQFAQSRERASIFTTHEDTELRGSWLILVFTSFVSATLYFTYLGGRCPDVFASEPPYGVSLLGGALVLVHYVVKLALYGVVNHTFYSPSQCRQWSDAWFVSVLLTGCCMLPLTLLRVFAELPMREACYVLILLLVVIKLLLLFKSYRIFFKTLLVRVHIISYFCALEILPTGFLLLILLRLGEALATS